MYTACSPHPPVYSPVTYIGGCPWGFLGRLDFVARRRELHYLLALEREGHTDGLLFNKIGEHYIDGYRYDEGDLIAKKYFQRSLDQGYALAVFNLAQLLTPVKWGNSGYRRADKAVLFLLGSDGKGLGIRDDRISQRVIGLLLNVKYNDWRDVECKLKHKGEKAVYYCDALIQRRSPLGYQMKAMIYQDGLGGVSKDMSKVFSIWKEAVNEGLADCEICYRLRVAYMYVPSIYGITYRYHLSGSFLIGLL